MAKTNTPKQLRVVIGFNAFTDYEVETTGNAVITGALYTDKILFPSPPVDLPTLQTAVSDFTVSITAAAGGGVHATSDKNKKRHGLIGLLRKDALYVEANCNGDETAVLAAGFQVVTRNRS